MRKMRLGIIRRKSDPLSLTLYREEILKRIAEKEVDVVGIPDGSSSLPKCDVVWDAGLGMRCIPACLYCDDMPIVMSVLGIRAFSLSLLDLGFTWRHRLEQYALKKQIEKDWRRMPRKNRRIIAISEFGGQDISRNLNWPEGQIDVIHCGVDRNVFKDRSDSDSLNNKYILHISVNRPGKNVDVLLKAYASIRGEKPELYLKIVGYPFRTSSVPGVKIIRDKLSESEIVRLYQGASLFILPSLYEHFGLPILEAMACGCPVITSNMSACPEVAGDAALIIDPRSVREMAAAMKRILTEQELRDGLRSKGLNRAEKFSWEKTAEAHLNVFRKSVCDQN